MNRDTAGRTAATRPRRLVALAACALLAIGLVSGCSADPSSPASSDDEAAARTGAGSSQPTVQRVLDEQSAALVRGDEAGYLSDVDPSAPELVARYRELFTTLRGLLVTGWDATVSGFNGEVALWAPNGPVTVTVAYCLGTPDCRLTVPNANVNPRAAMRMTFAVAGDHVMITGLQPPALAANTELRPGHRLRPSAPVPWQQSSLLVASGARTVVATTPALRDRLPAALAAAEAAAVVVDRFVPWQRPDRYYVYLAGPAEWRSWYQVSHGTEVGQAIPTSSRSIDILLKAEDVTDADLESAIRREMGHVVTMLGANLAMAGDDVVGSEWVSEGIAEFIMYAGDPPTALQTATRHLLDYQQTVPSIDRFLDVGRPADQRASYAFNTAAYLAIRFLNDTYGQDKLFQFVSEVLRVPVPVNTATVDVFDIQWPYLEFLIWDAISTLS